MDINILLKNFFSENKTIIVLYFIFMFVYPLNAVFLPKYYGQIAEDIKNNKKPSFKTVFILLLIVAILYYILQTMDTIFIPKLQKYIRVNVVKKILESFKQNYKEQNIGDLITKILKLPHIISELFTAFRTSFIPLIFILLMVIVQFMTINKKIGVITLMTIIVGIVVFGYWINYSLKHSVELDESDANAMESISDLFDNMNDVYVMNTIDREIEELEKQQDILSKKYKDTYFNINNVRTSIAAYFLIIFFILMVYSYNLFKNKKILSSGMVNVVITSMFIIGRISSFTGNMPELMFNLGIYLHIRKYLLNLPEYYNTESIDIKNGKINLKNVSINQGDKNIIENFSFNIDKGDCVIVKGENGCGKTTLINSILKLKDINEGQILIDDKDIDNIDPNSIRSQIMYVKQNPIPFNRTLYENIAYGQEDKYTITDVEQIIIDLKLDKYFNNIKLDEKVGKKGSKLSGGQRQMIFLLRILLSDKDNKKIVILDEPISFLDVNSKKYICDIIEKIKQNRTLIIISHDKDLDVLGNKNLYLKKNK